MANFDYSEFSWDDAKQGRLTSEQILKLVTYVCKAKYAQQAILLLTEQFSHMPDEKMLNYINLNPVKLLGIAVHSRREIPYGAELERLILDSECTYVMDHALSAEAEQKLVAVSSGYGDCKRDNYGEPLEAKRRKLSYYVSKFSSVRLLRLLLQQAQDVENPAKEKLWALEDAIRYLPYTSDNELLSDVDLQLDILELQNKNVSKWLLSKFTFKRYPAPEIIQQLIKTESMDLLRFLMAFSTVGTEMPEVCKAYPQLKTEVFLAELARLSAFFTGSTAISSYTIGDIIDGDDVSGILGQVERSSGRKLTETMEAICLRLYLAVDVKKARKKCYYDALNFCKAHSDVVEIAFFESMLLHMEDF